MNAQQIHEILDELRIGKDKRLINRSAVIDKIHALSMKETEIKTNVLTKNVQAKYWTLIFSGNGTYQMKKIAAFTLEDAVAEVQKDEDVKFSALWWSSWETFDSIYKKFKPFLK